MTPTETGSHSRGKDSSFLTHQEIPFNGEPPLARVGRSLVTPTPLFFVRNHAPVPAIDPDRFTLRVEGRVGAARSWTLDELRGRFDEVEVTATLQCAGNRRQELMAVREIPGEVGWACGAVGTAVWRGIRLREVLDAAAPEDDAGHVELVGADRIEKGGRTIGFGGSIPLEKALDPSVLLAWEMNGEPLPPEHGFPLRAVVPGYIGARSVKWLERVAVRAAPSDNFYQARSYRLFPPDATAETADWERAPSLDELALNAVITEPTAGATDPGDRPAGTPVPKSDIDAAGGLEVRGYAIAGGDRRVERVQVSGDGGRSWTEARLEGPNGDAAIGIWCLWSARVPVDAGGAEVDGWVELVARAWDSAGNGQPADVEPLWNFKGYMNNAWHRVRVPLD